MIRNGRVCVCYSGTPELNREVLCLLKWSLEAAENIRVAARAWAALEENGESISIY
jgi:hypothetical protein